MHISDKNKSTLQLLQLVSDMYACTVTSLLFLATCSESYYCEVIGWELKEVLFP